MPTILIPLDSSLSPERVLARVTDFTERRCDVFPAVEQKHFHAYAIGDETADVTEGTGTGIGASWERCTYDWSAPGCVTATVTDSNVYRPGSLWRLTASPIPGGSRVEMTWVRRFKRGPRGLLFGTAFRLVGRPLFRRYAKQIVGNLDALEGEVARARRDSNPQPSDP